jgi:hypothetical protein
LTDERQHGYQGWFATDDEALTAAVKAKSYTSKLGRIAPSKITVARSFTEWTAAIKDSVKPSRFINYADYQGICGSCSTAGWMPWTSWNTASVGSTPT